VPLSWQTVHLASFREASRVHRELRIDTSAPIDPFDALERLGVWVVRRPLDGAAGLYLPGRSAGQAVGVLINARHPLIKQRYTAAHELGHHVQESQGVAVRDRRGVVDSDTELGLREGDRSTDRERFAETFAAWFLMPKRLVISAVKELGIDLRGLTPDLAYRLALELGTSYRATVHHLGDLRMVSSAARRVLLETAPAKIKEALGARRVVTDLNRDVWHVDRIPRSDRPIRAKPGDLLAVDLAGASSTGYLWSPELPDGISMLGEDYSPPPPGELGGSANQRLWLRIEASGHAVVIFERRRPWQDAPASRTELRVEAVERPVPGLLHAAAVLEATA
jgi:Zn-dependent peptidase ImmA (M78 family)/predicted secreted protein